MKNVQIEFVITERGSTRRETVVIPMDDVTFSLTQTTRGRIKLSESYKFMFPSSDKVEIGLTKLLS